MSSKIVRWSAGHAELRSGICDRRAATVARRAGLPQRRHALAATSSSMAGAASTASRAASSGRAITATRHRRNLGRESPTCISNGATPSDPATQARSRSTPNIGNGRRWAVPARARGSPGASGFAWWPSLGREGLRTSNAVTGAAISGFAARATWKRARPGDSFNGASREVRSGNLRVANAAASQHNLTCYMDIIAPATARKLSSNGFVHRVM